ncbi:MAG: NADH-quinone oxidoreductase subunit L [Mycobacteriales bacterium]
MANYAWLIPTLPMIAFFVILFVGKRLPGQGAPVGIGAIAASTVVALGVLAHAISDPGSITEKKWLLTGFGDGRFTLGMKIDGLAAVMFVVVCVVSLLVQIYSTAYMHGDRRYTFFFAMLSLFTTGMLIVTIADNLLLLLVGWEIMGVCSYFLIGHYWEETPNSSAAIKAFLTTRIGDVGMMIGIFILFWGARSFEFTTIIERAEAGHLSHGVLVAGTMLVFLGAVGKSAQFPLHVWLPDAMAGPTPVSALIHAATMVASGIYLVARLYPVFERSGPALNEIGVLAAITMLGAALIALVQDDIKRVLAYSTVSQLAYMTGGLAVGGYTAGFFHLFTHAAFKALLFLGAGSVIHAVGTNNMSEMGGLRRALPRTHATYLLGSLALAGLPPLAAFWSKDEIIVDAFHAGFGGGHEHVLTSPLVGKLVFLAAVTTALLTAFYTMRMYCLTFRGSYRGTAHPHESPNAMTVPLLVLGVPAALAGLWNSPLFGKGSYFGRVVAFPGAVLHAPEINAGLALLSIALVVIGLGVGFRVYAAGQPARDPVLNMGAFTTLLVNKFYLDDIYMRGIIWPIRDRVSRTAYWLNQNVFDAPPNYGAKGGVALAHATYNGVDQTVIDGMVNGSGQGMRLVGRGLRLLQNGNVQAYATAMFVGVVAFAVIVSAQ